MKQYKKIQFPVFFLLLLALAMQGVGPLFTASMAHHEEPMHCTIASGCTSCSADGHSDSGCNCNHHAKDTDSREAASGTRVCGCTHHGSQALGAALSAQVKAVLDANPISFPTMNTALAGLQVIREYSAPPKDIFHPPRAIA